MQKLVKYNNNKRRQIQQHSHPITPRARARAAAAAPTRPPPRTHQTQQRYCCKRTLEKKVVMGVGDSTRSYDIFPAFSMNSPVVPPPSWPSWGDPKVSSRPRLSMIAVNSAPHATFVRTYVRAVHGDSAHKHTRGDTERGWWAILPTRYNTCMVSYLYAVVATKTLIR